MHDEFVGLIWHKNKDDFERRPEDIMDKPDWIEWDGKGNPPVGTVCLMYWRGVFHCKAEIIQYRRNDNQVIFWNIDNDRVDAAEIPTTQFYPLDTKREKWIEDTSALPTEKYWAMTKEAIGHMYDAIKAGKLT